MPIISELESDLSILKRDLAYEKARLIILRESLSFESHPLERNLDLKRLRECKKGIEKLTKEINKFKLLIAIS